MLYEREIESLGKRKTLGGKKKGGSCLEGLWSCMRCLMNQKNRYEEKETEPEPTDSLLELIWDLQSRLINDQRCSFNSSSKIQVQNTEHAVAVSTPGAEEDNVGGDSNRCASHDTYKTANESPNEEISVDCVNDKKLSQISTKNPSLRSSERAPSSDNPSAFTSEGDNQPAITSEGDNPPASTSQGDYENLKLDQLKYCATLGKGAYGRVELVDFGMAKEIGKGKTWTLCGSPGYIAPEIILEHGYDHTADYWSLGVVAFVLLSGRYPFDGQSHYEIFEAILDGIKRVRFPRKIGKHAKGFITTMCDSNPAERLGSGQNMEIKQHRWFHGFDWDGLNSQTMIPPIDPKVKGPTDCRNFSSTNEIIPEPPDEMSGWDINF